MGGPPGVGPKKEVTVEKKAKKPSPQELAQAGYKAARQTLGLEPPDKDHPHEISGQRYAKAIGFVSWGLKQLAKGVGKTSFQYLNDLALAKVIDPQRQEYLKMFLQIGAYLGVDHRTRQKLTVLGEIIKHLPAEVKEMTLADQTKFVLMVFALIHRESKFDPNCVSYTGTAFGLMQIQVPTAAEILKGAHLTPKEREKVLARSGHYQRILLNYQTNLRIGMKYLHKLLTLKPGPWSSAANRTFAFIAFNKGETGARGVQVTDYQQDLELRYQLYTRLHYDQVRKELEASRLFAKLMPHEQVGQRPHITPVKR